MMNKEEYTIEKIQIPRMIDLDVVASVNKGLSLIEELNKLAIEDTKEKYIRELLNRISKAIEYIEEKKMNCDLYGEQTFNVDDLLEILGGKNE